MSAAGRHAPKSPAERERNVVGRNKAAERDARRQTDIQRVLRWLHEAAPELMAPTNVGPIIEDLASSTHPGGWNSALGRLLEYALARCVGAERRADPAFGVALGRLAFMVSEGFVPQAHRPNHSNEAEHDAEILGIEGVTTIAEGIAALDRWDHASLLPHQVLVLDTPTQRKDRLRKRVERAAARGGITLAKRSKKATAS